jgi:hypothetical protein
MFGLTTLVIMCFYKFPTVSGFIGSGAVYILDIKLVPLCEIKMRCWFRIGLCAVSSFHITENPFSEETA